jgi:hypothetical protein
MLDTIYSTKLRDKTLGLVKNRPVHLTLKQISEETKLPVGWLKVFAQGKIDDPSCNRVETLYEFLSGEQLKV